MIYIYVGCKTTVCQINCVGGITWTKYAHAQSQLKPTCDTRVTHFDYTLEQLEKLKVNRASEQRKERLRIRPENEKIENHYKQRLATLKRLKRGDDNELKRNLRLEKVVAGKQLRLAMETEEERRTRLENDAAILKSWQLCLSFKLDVLTT